MPVKGKEYHDLKSGFYKMSLCNPSKKFWSAPKPNIFYKCHFVTLMLPYRVTPLNPQYIRLISIYVTLLLYI